jgi:hypothetical protein
MNSLSEQHDLFSTQWFQNESWNLLLMPCLKVLFITIIIFFEFILVLIIYFCTIFVLFVLISFLI